MSLFSFVGEVEFSTEDVRDYRKHSPALRAALDAIPGDLSKFFAKHVGATVDGLRFERARKTRHGWLWRVRRSSAPSAHRSAG